MSQNVLTSGAVGGVSGIMQSGAGKYPNPFCDIASEYVPRDLTRVFEYCEYIYMTTPTYRAASRRVVRYFLTELELDGESDEEREEYEDILNNDMHIMTELADIGDNFMVYGNVFLSLYFPFQRLLICPECGTEYISDRLKGRYKLDKRVRGFIGECPNCEEKVTYIRQDRRSLEIDDVKVIRWNPKHIKLRVHPISGKTTYYYEIPADFVDKIEQNNHFYLEDTPWSMIECILDYHDREGQPLYEFKDDAIYHFKESTLCGLPIRGWGIPPLMPSFKLAYYIQLMRRYDEAIALDFIVPFRVMYPDKSGFAPGQDPLSQMNMGNFVSHIQHLVENKRKNITDLQVSPYPIGYDLLGGEAQSLMPKDNILQATDELLNGMGFPAELYKGSLSIQAFPVALRLFEKTWGTLVDGYNDLIDWLVSRLARQFTWGDISGALRSVTLADDIERKALALQAAASMDISKATAYKPLGINYEDEQKRVIEEQELIQKLQEEAMARQQAAQMGMEEPAQGASPLDSTTTPGATPGDVYAQGQQLAQQLLFNTPETMRRGELIKIKHTNPTLHAIVTQEMDNIRQSMASQGQAMMMEQQKMASADVPSTFAISALVADQVCEYNRNDLRKIAMDIKNKVKGAKEAFHFVYTKAIRGLA